MKAKKIVQILALFLVFFCSFEAGAEEVVFGKLLILYSDSANGRESKEEYVLFDLDGKAHSLTNVSQADAVRLRGKDVKVTPAASVARSMLMVKKDIRVGKIEEVAPIIKKTNLARATSSVVAPVQKKWAFLLVKFSDGSFDIDKPRITNIVTSPDYPLVRHHSTKFSRGKLVFNSDIFEITIGSKNKYDFFNDSMQLFSFSQDVVDAVSAEGINLALYEGLAFIPNDSLGCCSYGGGVIITLGGSRQIFEAAWIPASWILQGMRTNVWILAHEMGHALGYPHVCGPDNDPYSVGFDTMSGSRCPYDSRDPDYGCIPVGYNMAYLALLASGIVSSDNILTSKPSEDIIVKILPPSKEPESAEEKLLVLIPAGVDNNGRPRYVAFMVIRRDGGYANYYPGSVSEGIIVYRFNLDPTIECVAKLFDFKKDGNTDWNDDGTLLGLGDSLNLSVVAQEVGDVELTVLTDDSSGAFWVELKNNNPPSGSLTATISPIGLGAQWRVDGGEWKDSGMVVSGLAVGQHLVEGKDIAGWTTPLAISVDIANGEMLNIDLVYTTPGAISVTLNPFPAAYAGAQWRISGGGWQYSGATVTGLNVGQYIIEASDVAGWITPPAKIVDVTSGKTTSDAFIYSRPPSPGSLSVLIKPLTAIGARWRVDGGPWKKSGATISGLSIGEHIVEFRNIAGWTSPISRVVSIASGQTIAMKVKYRLSGFLMVKIVPLNAVKARWRVDGGLWNKSGVILSGLFAGEHIVEFRNIAGWIKPVNRNVSIVSGQQTSIRARYNK